MLTPQCPWVSGGDCSVRNLHFGDENASLRSVTLQRHGFGEQMIEVSSCRWPKHGVDKDRMRPLICCSCSSCPIVVGLDYRLLPIPSVWNMSTHFWAGQKKEAVVMVEWSSVSSFILAMHCNLVPVCFANYLHACACCLVCFCSQYSVCTFLTCVHVLSLENLFECGSVELFPVSVLSETNPPINAYESYLVMWIWPCFSLFPSP